jgi:RNA polymerase primary sigma factor
MEEVPAPDIPGAVIQEMENAQLYEAIERLLPERAQYVLVRRYGLDNHEPATLAKLSEELDVSRERVRQIQLEAERILKAA